MKGKLIVLDGTDGSGKATQTKLLIENLKAKGYSVEMADFPQYGTKSAGPLEEYLNGKYGTAREVGPYRASILFAVDRFDGSFKIKEWLAEEKIIISNRYVTGNMGHQGADILDEAEREKYFKWLDELEYGLFVLPRPNLTVILHVPAEVGQQLVEKKGERNYLKGKTKDILEADIDHLRRAEKTYLQIAQQFPNFVLIKCAPAGKILPIEEIQKMIWEKVEPIIKQS